MNKQKVRRKLNKLILFGFFFSIILSNISLAVPSKRIFAEGTNNEADSANQQDTGLAKQPIDEQLGETVSGQNESTVNEAATQSEVPAETENTQDKKEPNNTEASTNKVEPTVENVTGSQSTEASINENDSSTQSTEASTSESQSTETSTNTTQSNNEPSSIQAELGVEEEPGTEIEQSSSNLQTEALTITDEQTEKSNQPLEVDYNLLPHLLITEIMPNNAGTGTDYYEFFEIYNNTNQPQTLSNYSFTYKYTDSGVEKPFQLPAVTIEPKKIKVFWFNNGDRTLADFNQNYGLSLTSDQVVEFKDVFTGFANGGNRAIVIKDHLGAEVISASYLSSESDNTGADIQYKYPPTGTEMAKLQVLAAPTPGMIATEQVPEKEVTIPENQVPMINHTPVTEMNAGEDLKIKADITDDQENVSVKLFYQSEPNGNFESIDMIHTSGQSYEATISKEKLTSDKVKYYLAVSDSEHQVTYPQNAGDSIEVSIKHPVEEDFNRYPQLLITELSPNSSGGGTDYYEFFEVYNNTNQPQALTNYSFIYKYTDTGAEKPFQLPAVTIEPQTAKVFWYNNGDRTLADFNQNYGLSLTNDQVVEFKDVFPGFANGGNRAIVIKDHSGAEVVSASYLNTESDNTGVDIQYKYPSSGTEMAKHQVLAASTPGTIDSVQVPAKPVEINPIPIDTEAPNITHSPVTNADAFTSVKVEATVTDNMAVPFATLFYKKEGEEGFTSLTMNASADGSTNYSAEIPSTSVESNLIYYIEATDGTNSAKTEEHVLTVKKSEVDYSKIPSFLVTEVVPDSTNVGSADGYEFVEIYNNTDKDLSFKDYKLYYRYGTDPNTDVIWPSVPDDVVIPSRKTLVFWIINVQNGDKTVADFNANYGTNLVENKDIVKIYSDGMANGSTRGLVVATNAKKELSVAYYFDEANVDDTQANKGIVYKYPVDGSTKSKKISAGLKDATPGAIESGQVPEQVIHIEEDGVKPTIENMTGVTTINQKEDIKIVGDASDNTDIKSVRLFYRTNTDTEYKNAILAEDFNDTMYHHTIYSPDIIGKKYVEYYFVVSDGTNEVTSDTYKIEITSDLNDDSLRLNVKNGDILKGAKILKGTSNTDSPDHVKLSIDGSDIAENTYMSVENPAYFAFEVSGVNTFFQNGVTMGEDIIRIFDDGINNWDTITVPIDADRLQLGDNIITVRAGNKASPFQLDESEENRDDFNIRNARLVLPDGTVIMDPAHNDPKKTYDMGDDGTYRPFEDFKFFIPVEHTPSKSYKWDTTSVSDGEHVVNVQDTDEKVSASVLIDNTAPVLNTNLIEGKEYKGNFNINVDASDKIAGVQTLQVMLDEKEIPVPFDTSSSKLSPGDHKLTIVAFDKVGNKAEKTLHFSVVNENPNKPELVSPTDGSSTKVDGNPTLKVKVTDPTNDTLDVSFYKGFKYDASKTNDVKAFKNAADVEPPNTMVPEGEQPFNTEDISLVSKEDQQYLVTDSNTKFPYHRFDVTVDSTVDETDLVELIWKGKSLEGRKVSMYAWNHTTNKWTTIDFKIAGQGDFELKGNVAVREFVKDNKINVLIQDEIPSSPDQYDYTFVWMSDTQYYADSYPWIYERMTNWIAEKQEEMKIKYVFHTGDIVDKADQEYQWKDADKFMKVLDDNHVPYGVLAGNHDVDHKTSDYTQYSKWFGEDRFKDKPYYGGSYKNNRGHYDLVSANGNDYIMLYMGWGVQDEDIQWMSDILKQYPDRKAILNFHEYLLVSGNRSPLGNRIYNQLVLPYKNVITVLSGHYHDSETLIDPIDDNGDGNPDRQVYQMLGDYQGGPEGGQGYMKLLHFDQKNNKMMVNTYSPYLDDYNFYDPSNFPEKDERNLELDLQANEKRVATDYFSINIYTDNKIGKDENVQSGDVAEKDWNDLVENTQYSWYAVVEDQFTGRAVSDIWTFTKGVNKLPPTEEPSNNGGGNQVPSPSDQGGNQAQTPSGQGENQNSNQSGNNANGIEQNQSQNQNNSSLESQQHTNASNNLNDPASKQSKDSISKLPNTATTLFNYLLIGVLCLILGAISLFLYKKYARKTTNSYE
ncbi:lamin tail domain-containing protein [Bacillus sp. 03113]|uniref:lamin tail domain-containing protein n=1 Tax=Bacillus sp. 03113 TaxID=2578211 RepID=UPI001144840A|nr:lamin tail domain-containing protein [Bacillus sp. 03113]